MNTNALYYTMIFLLGTTFISCLVYGLTISDDTISDNMIVYTTYRITLSTCVLIQICIWAMCVYSKRQANPDTAAWGLFSLVVTSTSWIVLANILSGTVHIVAVASFTVSFMVDLLILCNLTWQKRAVDTLILSVAFLLACMVVMTILFNTNKFYIMEHIGFIAYGLVFVVFFSVHPPADWGSEYYYENEMI